jgi:hypothetical protein
VGTVMTAELTCFPVKSDADCARRRNWRVATSEIVIVDGSPSSLSCIVNAIVPLCSLGWAEA